MKFIVGLYVMSVVLVRFYEIVIGTQYSSSPASRLVVFLHTKE
ncbi:hypothetical protein [Evansella clarkii]|nr:hypothetical protein [Evansella clarkii]